MPSKTKAPHAYPVPSPRYLTCHRSGYVPSSSGADDYLDQLKKDSKKRNKLIHTQMEGQPVSEEPDYPTIPEVKQQQPPEVREATLFCPGWHAARALRVSSIVETTIVVMGLPSAPGTCSCTWHEPKFPPRTAWRYAVFVLKKYM